LPSQASKFSYAIETTVAQEPGEARERGGSGQDRDDPRLWPFAAARLAIDACFWWLERTPPAEVDAALPWTTANSVALELPAMRLRDCSSSRSGPPALVCAPYALHRASIADFAPGHSVIASLRDGGIGRVYLTDWRSASPQMRYFSIDSCLSDLNIAIDEIGAPVDLVGLCQGGWLALVYAARFPAKVRRLVLVGAPVDLSVESALARLVRDAPQSVYEQLVVRGGGNVSGKEMLHFWSAAPGPADIARTLQRSLTQEGGSELLARFTRWNEETLNLPGAYYLQIVNRVFRENRIATGSFAALGRRIDLKTVTAPIFLLAGLDDEVVPAAQALATAALVGTPPALIAAASEPSNHLGLFMGARTHASAWPRIAEWLQADLGSAHIRYA
jgi:poly(3-hydroxyalkanoate) synthetase